MRHSILVLLLVLSACALPPPTGDARQCASNEECILVREAECCDCTTTVNKEYATWYEHQRPSVAKCQTVLCEPCANVDHAVCDNGLCSLR